VGPDWVLGESGDKALCERLPIQVLTTTKQNNS